PFYRCGYSAGESGGAGNQNSGTPFTTCDYTRAQCEQRGMFATDAQSNATRRFGGIEFVPASILVRAHGERGLHVSAPVENEARYNDFVPLVYGTALMEPPIVFARNDGNLTRMEILLGTGEIQGVVKVLVNDIEIPEGQSGQEMTGTGWYNVVSLGARTGGFNLDFTNQAGNPLGDPYGSMAFLSVVVPNRISDGRTLPRIRVLLQGMKLARYHVDGSSDTEQFTNNPAWVLLDILQRSGWTPDEIDLASFATAALYCGEPIDTVDLHGNPAIISRFQCNLAVRRRRSAADLIRSIRTASNLLLGYDTQGKLQLRVERTLAAQQPVKPAGSNSTQTLNGGWPAYEFGDGTSGSSGIARRANGEPSLRLWARRTAESPNRLSVEFQDEFNEYQQDSLSLVDVDDALQSGQEVSAPLAALGIPNFHQAARIMRLQLDKSIRGNFYAEFQTSVKGLGLRPGDIIALTYLREGFLRRPFRITRLAPGLNHRSLLVTAQAHDDLWYTDAADPAGGGLVSRREPDYEVGLPRPLVGSVLDASGEPQIEIVEGIQNSADGSVQVLLEANFTPPAKPDAAGVGIPLLSLAPAISTTGGTLNGGRTYYYAISAKDSDGRESRLSFIVRATIPAGTSTNRVTLQNLSFPSGTQGFDVYRGGDPIRLLKIAQDTAVSTQFIDTGLPVTLAGPPDENFDHARFYWRLELHPEITATVFSATTVGNSSMQMQTDEYAGMVVRLSAGKGMGQERVVLSNNATVLTVTAAWTVAPDATSKFVIAQPTWRLGASGSTSPVVFEAPNRPGATVHVSGRAANVHGREAAYELSPLTRWQIDGGGGSLVDNDVAEAPTFAVSVIGQGTVELAAVAFSDLQNTSSIESGTMMMHFWNELSSPSAYALSAAMSPSNVDVFLAAAGAAQPNDLIQIDGEILKVTDVLNGGLQYVVTRGGHGSTAASHAAQAPVYHLDRKVFVIPFPRGFFGSPASGSYSYSIFLPDVRLAAAEMFVTNSRGNSQTTKYSYTATADKGLRTLSGGQLTMQVEGPLAIQDGAAPPLVVEAAHSVRDIFAVVANAPTLVPVDLRLMLEDQVYANLTIDDGEVISNVVDGFGKPPLGALQALRLDIVSVGQTFTSSPGRDLTVIIRL
ncbi:MAG: phage tail protein, partial [Bryobacteraceae bacterium]